MKSDKIRLLAFLFPFLGFAAALPVGAQEPASGPEATAPVPPALAAAQAQHRRLALAIDDLAEEIIATDREIERRVTQIVRMLAEASDSTESGTEVLRLKEKVSEGLKKTIDVYLRERQKAQADLSTPYRKMTSEDDQKRIAAMDDKIDTRISQILQLTESMARSQEFERYEYHYRDNRRGGGVSRRETDEYDVGQRQNRRAESAVGDVTEALDEAVAGLERENAALRSRLAGADSRQKEAIESQIRANEERIARRREQAGAAADSPGTKGRPVGDAEADSLERRIADLSAEARTDFNRLIALKNELDLERQKLKACEARIRTLEKSVPTPPPAL